MLQVLPLKVGDAIYHKIQERSFKSIDQNLRSNKASWKLISRILSNNFISLEGAQVIEIGSGWLPLMPYLFKTEGNVKKVFTYDINAHYNKDNIARINTYFNNSSEGAQGELPDFIEYFPRTNVATTRLPNNIDFCFSRFVLEHVPPEAIKAMHQRFFDEMKEGAYVLHLISPSDHRAYSDSSLSYYDFLKYSQKQWDAIQTRFDYHNRLRLPQYVELFEEIGFKIVYLDYDQPKKDSVKYKMFKHLKLHEDFAKYTEEEILAGSINVLLQKP
ncbi:class I SAM-dependent methyltransferase [Neptunitalea lumnitzerae]|uniref:Methyltransferase domain-containing protein n=1 Tax=Neptunitalea lumnitzerae TaxID=2965509 RepID=A0ABQ5MM98_9FLAO|nr:methyltransferase domain-containing protein [Neptunitalea sp. Y10]GLB50494.1 hypothetical protein Y10_28620 [Neptunitalea sp. Y10]